MLQFTYVSKITYDFTYVSKITCFILCIVDILRYESLYVTLCVVLYRFEFYVLLLTFLFRVLCFVCDVEIPRNPNPRNPSLPPRGFSNIFIHT